MPSAAHVALLRGINVGGVRIRMADLSAAFRDLGLGDVRTVLASGNVVFTADAPPEALKATLERGLAERFGYEAFVFVVSPEAVCAAIEGYPFDEDDPSRQPYAVFTADDATRAALLDVARTEEPDARVAPGPGLLWWSPERGRSLDGPLARELGKARYKPLTTTRNLRTLRKILARLPTVG